jgi:hypothetical protein
VTRTRSHCCEDGYVYHGSPLIGPALRRCSQCQDICTRCRNAGCFAPRWLDDPVAVAESIVDANAHGYGYDLCHSCGGVTDMTRLLLVGGDVMTAVRIARTGMVGETTSHRADPEDDGWRVWRVSWLSDRLLTYDHAVTAMVIAETVATDPELHPGHRLWPHLLQWAAELGLSGADAVALVGQPESTGRDQRQGDVS